MADNLEIAATLEAAGALVAAGWVQEPFEKCSGSGVCYCAAGALYRAAEDFDERIEEEAFRTLTAVVGLAPDPSFLFEWNDAPERTQADVVEAFRKAAELARASA